MCVILDNDAKCCIYQNLCISTAFKNRICCNQFIHWRLFKKVDLGCQDSWVKAVLGKDPNGWSREKSVDYVGWCLVATAGGIKKGDNSGGLWVEVNNLTPYLSYVPIVESSCLPNPTYTPSHLFSAILIPRSRKEVYLGFDLLK